MKLLKNDEIKCIAGADLVCTESAVAYFEDEGSKCMKIFVTLKGLEEDFQQLARVVSEVK